jgi:methionine-gamma-lyase
MTNRFDPVAAMAAIRHEFGEYGGVNPSIEASTTFTVLEAHTLPDLFHGYLGPQDGCFLYGRHIHPTVLALGRQLAAMEGTEAAYATSSGMGAISATLLHLLRPGDRLVMSQAVYGGTYALAEHVLRDRLGVDVRFVDIADPAAVRAAVDERTRVLYTETFSNPTLVVADLPRLADIAHGKGARFVVDNTFSPLILSPARHGADIVLHSLTKYISGGSDLIAGAVCGSRELIMELMDPCQGSLVLLGPTLDARAAFAIHLRLPHLGLRMAEHGRRGQYMAEGLADLGLRTIYPGLPEHPQHDLLGKLANPGYGCGGLLAVDLETEERANRFMEMLQNEERFGYMAVSLGYFDTLLSASAHSTSSEMGEEALERAGISPGLVRISLGYTGTLEQRWDQLTRVLEKLGHPLRSCESA